MYSHKTAESSSVELHRHLNGIMSRKSHLLTTQNTHANIVIRCLSAHFSQRSRGMHCSCLKDFSTEKLDENLQIARIRTAQCSFMHQNRSKYCNRFGNGNTWKLSQACLVYVMTDDPGRVYADDFNYFVCNLSCNTCSVIRLVFCSSKNIMRVKMLQCNIYMEWLMYWWWSDSI